MERSKFSSTHLRGEIMAIVTVGIDLAKNVFAVHGVDETGKPALVRPEVPRAKLQELIALAAVPDRSGSLLGCAPLGPVVRQVRPHGTPDGPQVRHPLPHERQTRQERCSGRRSHLRSGHPAQHAPCTDLEHRPTIAPVRAARTLGLPGTTHRADQPHTWPTQ